MDFSGIYEDQQFWRGKEVSRVEARDIPGTNCYCDEDAMNAIRSRIAPYSSGGIHFIDSGNYHYMTRIWLEKISEPFSLLVFDNHTDMQPPAFGGLLSCGGWIYDSVMELPLLKRVILIGPDEEAFSRVESEIQEKVEFLSREKLLEMEEAQVCAFVSKHVGKLPLYISVDKDVLTPSYSFEISIFWYISQILYMLIPTSIIIKKPKAIFFLLFFFFSINKNPPFSILFPILFFINL